ncbi:MULTISPECIES: flavin reductase family protein [unclassified Acinetobacter]|uniref:flavin reductase family protein n=1 Tax=unclassified Acinetobacter TaxID=196816 RepID=UPI0035B74FD0
MNSLLSKSYLQRFNQTILTRPDVDFWLHKANPLWSFRHALGKIVKKSTHGQNVCLTLRCNHLMQFGKAGQHHPVMIEIAGRRYQRQYSLTQLDRHHVLLTAKKFPQGLVSSWLYDDSKIGEIVQFGTPYGEMQIDKNTPKVLMLAAGSGITPLYSLLYDFAQQHRLKDHQIDILYWQKHQQDAVFLDELLAWQKQYPNLKVHTFFTQQSNDDKLAQRLNHTHLDGFDLAQTQVLACGAYGFIDTVETLAKNAKSLHTESFSLAPANIAQDPSDTVQVTLKKSGQILTVSAGQALLPALEQANIRPKFGCRMGICNHCSCHKVSGSTENVLDHSQNHEINQELRICVNRATSDIVLDL